MTPEELREDILTGIEPLEGTPIYQRGLGDEEGYTECIKSLARAMLVTAEEKPELLDVSKEKEADPTGWEAANNDKFWEATKEKFPGLDDWLGGITGYQFGVAHGAVRYALGAEATGNPALVEVKTRGEDDE